MNKSELTSNYPTSPDPNFKVGDVVLLTRTRSLYGLSRKPERVTITKIWTKSYMAEVAAQCGIIKHARLSQLTRP